MPANDAFTAGVRPGGLTSSTEIRLLLCYLVKNAGPIARQEIENALMEEALVNYFEYLVITAVARNGKHTTVLCQSPI